MFGKRKQTVGLYIGPRTIAMAYVHVTASGTMVVDRLAISDTPVDAVDSGGIVDVDAVSRAIGGFSNARTGQVALAISADSVAERLLTLPEMPRHEMLAVLKGEVGNYAVLTGEEPVLDFQIVDRRAEGIGQKLVTLVVAVSEPLLNSYVTAVESANLKLVAVEAAPMAILRVLASGQLQDKVMLVSIEERGGVIIVASNGIIQFIHTIEMGRESLLERDSALAELVDELSSSLSYCNTKFLAEGSPREIILSIDGVNNRQICDELGERLGISVTCLQLQEVTDEHIKAQTMDYGLSAHAAIGAALHARTGASDSVINLLTPQSTAAVGLRRKVSIVLVCMISVMLLGICASLILRAMADSMMDRALSIQQTSEVSVPQIYRELADVEIEAARLRTKIDLTRTVISSVKHVDWGELLQKIGAMVPENAWLSGFAWENDDGLSLDGFALSYDSVFELRETLTDSPYFSSARLVFAKKIEVKGRLLVEFEILCGVRRRKRSFNEIARLK